MFRIRNARRSDWDSFILPQIRKHPDYMQQERLPSWNEFLILELFGMRLGCIALKVYWTKLAEIQSLVFESFELEKDLASILVSAAILLAERQNIKQLMVTVGKRHKELFQKFGFDALSNLKYGLLGLTEDLDPYLETIERRGLPEGFWIEDLKQDEYEEVRLFPFPPGDILTDPRFFPDWDQFCVVKNAEGKKVGCCALTVFDRLFEGRPEMAEIRTMFVLPGYEHQGLGQALCADRCRLAIKLGVIELFAVSKINDWFERNFGLGAIRGSETALFRTLESNK